MKTFCLRIIPASLVFCPAVAVADPSLECSMGQGSQVEIGACVGKAASTVDQAMALALSYAKDAAADLDATTGRASSAPALEAAQGAWEAYRDAHCDFVGTTWGGGSGTGIAIQSCRVELGRARIDALLDEVR